MLLIIDNNANILKYFACESVYINAGDNTLLETLNKISNHSQVKNIYFPLEIKFKNTQRQYFEGLELLKHIRLTKDLGNLQYAPILLGYTYPLETVLRNPESTILCAPATHLFHLKNINQVNNSKLFKSEEKLTRDTLKPYILYTDTDKATTDHVRRNEHGPLKLDRELNGTSNSDIGLDLWQKQILFLQTEATNNQTQPPSKIEFKCAIKGKRILYLDDEAYKWENPLKKLFQGATLDIKSDYLEIVKYLDEIQLEQDKIRPRYTDIDKQLLKEFLSVGKTHEFELKISERYRLQNKLAGLLNYDLILLDMRLDKTADSDKPINLISGVQVLKKIQALNPFIPIVMFTASNKVDSYKSSIDNGAYEFWVKNVSSANDLKTKSLKLLKNELQGKRLGNINEVYAKLLMIKSRASIYNYSLDVHKAKIESKPLSDLHRERMDDSVWHFIKFIQRYMFDDISDFDIEELWKMTGETIQIRVPVIYGLTESAVKRMDDKRKIDHKEFDFRWNRNYFTHSVVDDYKRNLSLNPYDKFRAIEYINHTIDYLLDYR